MSVVIYDPVAADAASSVRGIGRYVQLLHENLPNAIFTASLNRIPPASTLLMPFLNLTQPPAITRKLAKRQIAVIHDLIPLKNPHDFPIGLRGSLNVFRNKQTLKLYDTIVTNSEASKKDIINILKVPERKITVVYPCLPKSFMEKEKVAPQASPTVPYFLYVGDATANKNLACIARAIQAAEATCVFAGKVFVQPVLSDNPWNNELNEFLKLSHHSERLILPGYVSDEKLLGLYRGAVANILLSTDEGFGFSYLEAAHCKTPSLLSDIPTFHETAADSALFTTPSGVEQIAMSLRLLMSEKKLRNELAGKAYERSKFFSAEKFKKKWEALLELK